MLAIPNVSEGSRPGIVNRLSKALASSAGSRVLDVSSDADHNRTVLTAYGDLEALARGLVAMGRAASSAIDLREHAGAHPRLGALMFGDRFYGARFFGNRYFGPVADVGGGGGGSQNDMVFTLDLTLSLSM